MSINVLESRRYIEFCVLLVEALSEFWNRGHTVSRYSVTLKVNVTRVVGILPQKGEKIGWILTTPKLKLSIYGRSDIFGPPPSFSLSLSLSA